MNESVNRVRHVLAELIKAALISDDERSLGYRNAARQAQEALAADPPDPASVKIDGAWTLAIQDAEAPDLQPVEGRVNLTLQRECPFTLDEMIRSGFDIDEGVNRICNAASTG